MEENLSEKKRKRWLPAFNPFLIMLLKAASLTLSHTSPSFFKHLQCISFENTVGKGENAPFPTGFPYLLENFLPYSSNFLSCCVQTPSFVESKFAIQEGIKVFESQNCVLTHSHTMTPFDAPGKQAF